MSNVMTIEIEYRGEKLYRDYVVEGRWVPQGAKDSLQEMKEVIDHTLDSPTPF